MVKKAKKKVVRKVQTAGGITKAIASKVLEVVDAGLIDGVGKPIPGQMCVEAAVAFAMGEKFGDEPSCVQPAIRRLKIIINDDNIWYKADTSSGFRHDVAKVRRVRAKALRRLAIAQLGSEGVITASQFERAVKEYMLKKAVDNDNNRIDVEKQLTKALTDIKAGKRIEASFDYYPPDVLDMDIEEVLADVETTKEAALICEDIVQILIKLKSPGTKFLYLTEK